MRANICRPGPAVVVALAVVLACAGCGDEDPAAPVIDFVATAPATGVQNLRLRDDSRPLHDADVLYLGTTGAEAASIMARFDFSVLADPDSAYLIPYLQADNIGRTWLRMYGLTWYEAAPQNGPDGRRPWYGSRKVYEVHRLSAVPQAWPAPAPEPAFLPAWLSDPLEQITSGGPCQVELEAAACRDWIAGRIPIGLLVREGPGSQPGVVGLASASFTAYSLIEPVRVGTVVGPSLLIELLQSPPSWPEGRGDVFVLPADWDAATWHATPPDSPPADDFVLPSQTGGMNLLRFRLDDELPYARLLRADLVLTSAPDTSAGLPTLVTCHDAAPALADTAADVWNLADLADAVSYLGQATMNPERAVPQTLRFDVTTAVRDALARDDGLPLALLLSGCDPTLTGGDCARRPWWFGYSRMTFRGTGRGAPDAPHLELTFVK